MNSVLVHTSTAANTARRNAREAARVAAAEFRAAKVRAEREVARVAVEAELVAELAENGGASFACKIDSDRGRYRTHLDAAGLAWYLVDPEFCVEYCLLDAEGRPIEDATAGF